MARERFSSASPSSENKDMKTLKPDQLIRIDPVRGWHYHMPNCKFAGDLVLCFKDLPNYKPAVGKYFKKCACIDAFLSGKELKKL